MSESRLKAEHLIVHCNPLLGVHFKMLEEILIHYNSN